MSPDEFHLLLVLYALYLSDCFIWTRRSSWLLFSCFRGAKWRVKSTESSPVVGGRFFLLRPLIPPMGSTYQLPAFPLSFGKDGMCSVSFDSSCAGKEPVLYLPYGEITSVTVEDGALWVNDKIWVKGCGECGLKRLQQLIHGIINSENIVTETARLLNVFFERGAEAAEQIRSFEQQTERLNFWSSVYAMWLLVFIPVLLIKYSLYWLLWAGGVPILLLHVVCGVFFWCAHKRVFPDLLEGRKEALFKMAICPPMMIRACDVIMDAAVFNADRVAVIVKCANRSVWLPLIQQVWRKSIPCEYPYLSEDEAKAVREFASSYRQTFADYLHREGIDLVSLDIPADEMPHNQCYCPRCGGLYRLDFSECSDCVGVKLKRGLKR